MVGIGEYSPNYRGNRPSVEGTRSGIFGEYEERRKYYNEQRKLEYQQYLAQKTLNTTCHSDTENGSHSTSSLSHSRTPSTPYSSISCELGDIASSCVRKEVATQTSDREQRDASTNTDESNSSIKADNNGAMDGLTSLLKEKDDQGHLNLNSFRVINVRDIRDQNENRIPAERNVRREKQGEEFKNRWSPKENSWELERPRVKEKHLRKELVEKDSSNKNILSHLGEVRRNMATKQMKMEESLKKNKSQDKGV